MSRRSLRPTPVRRRALTLVEILVAVVLSGILFSSVIASFVMILRTSREGEIQSQAVSNARAALEDLSVDLKQAERLTPGWLFVGVDDTTATLLGHGNGIDDDFDGRIDAADEAPNGRDDDLDAPANASRTGHSLLSNATTLTLYERPRQYGDAQPHFGNPGVDEDCVFHHDRLAFFVHPPSMPPSLIEYRVENYRDTLDPADPGTPNVLTRTATTFLTTTTVVSKGPVAYDVLSFNCLYWDDSLTPPDWVAAWNQSGPGGDVPASILAEITVYADPKPVATYQPGQPVRTVTLRTAVNPAPANPTVLAAHWRFDDTNTVAADSSGHGRDLTLANTTPALAWQPGFLGGGLALDGANAYAATASDVDLFAASNDLTIAFWVLPAASQEAAATILDADRTGNGGQNCGIVQTTATNRYAFVFQSGGAQYGDDPVQGLHTALEAGVWQHFAVVKSGGALTHYRNGRAVGTIAVPVPLVTAPAPLRVGHGVAAGGHFGGLLDDMRIYDRALMPGEIAALVR